MHSANGNTGQAYQNLGSGVTSQDYFRDVALGIAGAAVAATGVAKPGAIISEGTANAATAAGLSKQLINQNLANIAAQDSRLTSAVNGSGTTNPNFIIGGGSVADSLRLGKIWVGDGARLVRRQNSCPGCLISSDGTRIYRPPQPKTSSFATTGTQANFVQQTPSGTVISNGHLNIN